MHDSPEEAAKQAIQNRRLLSAPSYPSYLIGQLTGTPFWIQWKRWLSYLRRLRTVTFVLKCLAFALSVLQTGTLVLLSGILIFALLPPLLLLLAGYGVAVRIRARRTTRRLISVMRNQPVYILFPASLGEAFILQNARELATRGLVLLVSPHLLSSALPFEKRGKFFATAHELTPNMYLIRRYYLPLLQKHLPKQSAFLF